MINGVLCLSCAVFVAVAVVLACGVVVAILPRSCRSNKDGCVALMDNVCCVFVMNLG
jgi:hypothetical protein